MENKTMYRIVLTCWDKGELEPYADCVTQMFDTEEEARATIRSCVKDELEGLNDSEYDDVDMIEYPVEHDAFKADFDGDNDAIIRFWDGDDYWPVTAYNIHKVEPISDHSWSYRALSVTGKDTNGKKHTRDINYSVAANMDGNLFTVFLGDEKNETFPLFEDALAYIDDEILRRQNASKRVSAASEDEEWVLPVTWEVCGFVKVKGSTLEEAIENFDRDIDYIPLPTDSSYVDGSFDLTSRDDEFVQSYNNKKYSLLLCEGEPEEERVTAFLTNEQANKIKADIKGEIHSQNLITLTDGRIIDSGIVDSIKKI